MFDNLIESINAQLPLTEESTKLIDAVAKTPDLSYFGEDKESTPATKESERLPIQELNKASFLRLLRTCFLCSPDNRNYQQCKKINDAIMQKNALSTILTQLSSFQFIVGVETLIALQKRNHDALLSDESYQTKLIKTASSAPEHLQPLYCFAILQLLGFRNLYKKPEGKVKKLPNIAHEVCTEEIFYPLLFASSLDPEKSVETYNLISHEDVFDTILNRWIEPMSKILLLQVIKICLKEVFYLMSRFLRLYSVSLMNQDKLTVRDRILPLISRIVITYPKLFTKFLADFNIFRKKNLADLIFPQVLHFLSCSCNSKENAITVLKLLTGCQSGAETIMNRFFKSLKEAHDELIIQDVSVNSLSSLYLLKNLFKFLPNKYQENLVEMFKGSEIDTPEVSLASFLWDFMKNEKLAPNAAKCLFHLSALHPGAVYRFFNDPSSFDEIAKMMSMNEQIMKSFVKIAQNFVSFSFCIKAKSLSDSEIPPFPKFLITNYFAISIFNKFDRRSKRWSILTSLLETALDITYCDLDFCSELQNNADFAGRLFSVVHQTDSILGKPPTVIQESDSVRIDSDNLSYIIQFDCVAMTLMIRLITYNLMNLDGKNQNLSYMCKSFFTDNFADASSLFTTFVSFLELTHPLASRLRYFSVKMLDLMCEIAGRIPNISVTSFYPHESQRVLKELASTNLFKSNDVNQVITQLDFISHAFSSQLPFAYSFVHRIGSSFVTAATSNIEEIVKQYPDWLLSLSHLLSMMFQKLSLKSNVITKISEKQQFWTSLWNIIKKDLPADSSIKDKCCLIAAKSELLNVAIKANQKIEKNIISILFTQMKKFLPEKFDPIYVDCQFDASRFVRVELHRVYGKEFYLDTDLLKRYLVDEDKIIKKAKDFNESLSIIDACTQLMSTIVSYLKVTPDQSMIPAIKDSLKLLKNVLRNDIYPDSTVNLFFSLVDVCMANVSSPINNIDGKLLRALAYYMDKRPNESTFSIIAKFIASSEIDDSEELIHMLEPCINYSLKVSEEKGKKCSPSALKCASEIAFKLINKDGWISLSPESALCFFKLLPTPLGCAVVDFMTLILMNSHNAATLESSDFFEQLSQIKFLDSDSHNPVWSHIFTMMTAIPDVSNIPYTFASTHLNQIAFYLGQNPATFIKDQDISSFASATSILNSSDALLLFNTQLSIMELLAKIASEMPNFLDREDPVQHEMFLKIVSERMRKSLQLLNESSQLKINKGGNNKYDRDTYNCKTYNLLILRYCLIFFNCLFEFPGGEIPIILDKSTSSNPILDLMEKAADALKETLASDARIFNEICVEAFEYVLRIYTAKMFLTAGIENERKYILETKNSFLRSISSVRDSIKKYQIKEQDSFNLLDAANEYIANITL